MPKKMYSEMNIVETLLCCKCISENLSSTENNTFNEKFLDEPEKKNIEKILATEYIFVYVNTQITRNTVFPSPRSLVHLYIVSML